MGNLCLKKKSGKADAGSETDSVFTSFNSDVPLASGKSTKPPGESAQEPHPFHVSEIADFSVSSNYSDSDDDFSGRHSWRPDSATASPVRSQSGSSDLFAVPDAIHEARKWTTPEGLRVINDYVLKDKLGQGSYGVVYRAESLVDHKPYAIKVIKKSLLKQHRLSQSKVGLFREISIMKRLDHGNVVHLYDVIDDKEAGRVYLVLEYVEGGPVMTSCMGPSKVAPLSEAVARDYFRDIILGLDYVHSNHIVHMDIKPENLLVGADGHVRITDFGVSNIFQGSNDMINKHKGGSPAFTAPEVINGGSYSGKMADIWAVGVSLYYFVYGRCPFVGDSIAQLFFTICNEELIFPFRVNDEIEDLLRKMLSKEAADRISMSNILRHPWVTEGGTRPIVPAGGPPRIITFAMMVKLKTRMRKRALEARRMTYLRHGYLPDGSTPRTLITIPDDRQLQVEPDGSVICSTPSTPCADMPTPLTFTPRSPSTPEPESVSVVPSDMGSGTNTQSETEAGAPRWSRSLPTTRLMDGQPSDSANCP